VVVGADVRTAVGVEVGLPVAARVGVADGATVGEVVCAASPCGAANVMSRPAAQAAQAILRRRNRPEENDAGLPLIPPSARLAPSLDLKAQAHAPDEEATTAEGDSPAE